MVIMDQEWNSLTDYDDALKQIEHYQLHETMLPFIGRHYPNTRILILGESHYLSNEESNETKKLKEWYSRPTAAYSFRWPDNFNTRHVVRNYLTGHRSKAHTMFSNPAKALINAWNLENVNDSEAFTAFAFMNYFQRPAVSSGETISLTADDETRAFHHLNKVIEIINPALVMFLSKKAGDSYKNVAGNTPDPRIACTSHPTTKYWNDAQGKDEAIRQFSSLNRYAGFSLNGQLTIGEAKLALNKYRIIEKHHKRFFNGEITVSIYPASNSNYVSEIVWHVVDQGTKLGIGYVVDKKLLWIWDYTAEKFLGAEALSECEKLGQLYNEACQIISAFPE